MMVDGYALHTTLVMEPKGHDNVGRCGMSCIDKSGGECSSSKPDLIKTQPSRATCLLTLVRNVESGLISAGYTPYKTLGGAAGGAEQALW